MRTAIVHYWLVAERGGEKVVQALCEMFPDAVIFTHVADPDLAARMFPGHEVRTSFISKLPFSRKRYQQYLPLMPMALEELDLSGFDLVISSESGPAKGVIAAPGALHVCYCHSPMRYIWDHYHVYRENAGLLARVAFPWIAHGLRQWDVTSAARVDHFVANSAFVASRIEKYYRRTADIAHPPVDVARFAAAADDNGDTDGVEADWADAYLWVGQLTTYKRPDLAIRATQALVRKLVVIGDGEMYDSLRKDAGPDVTFLGRADDATVRRAYRSCRAFLFPGEEDFGMTPVEAMAAGTPVIALGRGGACETVLHARTGVLYEPGENALQKAIREFESLESDLDRSVIKRHAEKFGRDAFKQTFARLLRSYGVDPSDFAIAPEAAGENLHLPVA